MFVFNNYVCMCVRKRYIYISETYIYRYICVCVFLKSQITKWFIWCVLLLLYKIKNIKKANQLLASAMQLNVMLTCSAMRRCSCGTCIAQQTSVASIRQSEYIRRVLVDSLIAGRHGQQSEHADGPQQHDALINYITYKTFSKRKNNYNMLFEQLQKFTYLNQVKPELFLDHSVKHEILKKLHKSCKVPNQLLYNKLNKLQLPISSLSVH